MKVAANAHQANLGALKSDYETSAKGILDQINVHREEVEKLVGVIGNLGVTSGYQKVANLARKMLFIWQGVTVLALGGLIIVAFQMAFPSPTKAMSVVIEAPQVASSTAPPSMSQPKEKEKAAQSVSAQTVIQTTPVSDSAFYQGLATRIFLSLTFGIFAAYAAKQASHFLDMERKNRKLALELEALGPYIAPLDKVSQDEFRIKIGDRSFGVHDHDLNNPKPDDPVTAYGALNLKELGELVANIAKGMK